MKAYIVIPRGWRSLRVGSKVKRGDRVFSPMFLEWHKVLAPTVVSRNGFIFIRHRTGKGHK